MHSEKNYLIYKVKLPKIEIEFPHHFCPSDRSSSQKCSWSAHEHWKLAMSVGGGVRFLVHVTLIYEISNMIINEILQCEESYTQLFTNNYHSYGNCHTLHPLLQQWYIVTQIVEQFTTKYKK